VLFFFFFFTSRTEKRGTFTGIPYFFFFFLQKETQVKWLYMVEQAVLEQDLPIPLLIQTMEMERVITLEDLRVFMLRRGSYRHWVSVAYGRRATFALEYAIKEFDVCTGPVFYDLKGKCTQNVDIMISCRKRPPGATPLWVSHK